MPLPVDIKGVLSAFLYLFMKYQAKFTENQELIKIITVLNKALKKDLDLPSFEIPTWITYFSFIKQSIKELHIFSLECTVQQMLHLLELKSKTIAVASSRRRGQTRKERSDESNVSAFAEKRLKCEVKERKTEPLPQLFNVGAFLAAPVRTAETDFSAKLQKFKQTLDNYLRESKADNPALLTLSQTLKSVTAIELSASTVQILWDEFYGKNKINDIILGIEGGKCIKREYLELRYEMLNKILPPLHKLKSALPKPAPERPSFLLGDYSEASETVEVFGGDSNHHRLSALRVSPVISVLPNGYEEPETLRDRNPAPF